MLGHKTKAFKTYTGVTIDDLVPEDNFYRHLEGCVDLGFIRDLVQEHYADMGRPSIDPVVFFKLQLIAFFEDIRSERKLIETATLNLAHRWYLGYDLDEPLPDPSSLSKIRERYGLDIFQRFFEHIVELCIESGLVWGKELYFDGTKVRANASLRSLVPNFFLEAQHQVKGSLTGSPPAEMIRDSQPESWKDSELSNKPSSFKICAAFPSSLKNK